MPLRVALLAFNLPDRGTYYRAYHIGRQLARRGHSCTFIYTAPEERRRFAVRTEEGGRFALVAAPDALGGSLRSGWDLYGSLARTLLLGSTCPDIVHAFECRPAVFLPALAAARSAGAPLVSDWCDWFGRGGSVEERPPGLARAVLRPVETFFEERLRPVADAATVINTTLRERTVALGLPPERIRLVTNGCEVDEASGLEPMAEARAALGLPAHAPLLGYAGAIFARDAELLAAAFDRVYAARPDAKLLIVGHTNAPVEELVAHPEAVVRLASLGALDQRRGLRACDVGWLPLCDTGANRGRWPVKISVYMELGLPIVSAAVGDIGPFFKRYPAGVAAAPTPQALADATLALLDDPARRAELGATGRRLAEGELSWARVTDIVEQLYLDLLGR